MDAADDASIVPAPMPDRTLVDLAATLRDRADRLRFGPPVACVYNPLRYAWEAHKLYLERFGRGPKRVVFLGMNPGPWGMVQTGVPFGEVAVVRAWMRLEAKVGKPAREHPKRPVDGFACRRSEVSGRRLWGLFSSRYPRPEAFFRDQLVLNYCPLVWMEDSGRNRTPDKLPAPERAAVDALCDRHLRQALALVRPQWAVGIGAYAEAKLREATPAGAPWAVTRIPHPSPASPAANRGWAAAAERALLEAGVW